jgi:dTMP kinase
LAGAFITFEGIDGSGKSTQLRLLASWLRMHGVEVVQTREPGGTQVGKRLRAVVLDPQLDVDPLAELLLFAADRAQHVKTLLRPAIQAGNIILSDRYADATVAYQGAGRNFTPGLVAQVIELATGGLKPDMTLVFDLPVAECVARTNRRAHADNQSDRLETEDTAFYTRVRNAYLQIAAAEPDRVRIINASGSINEIHTLVLELVKPLLNIE